MPFQGFGAQALPFFKALAFHQTKEWFEANRAAYEAAIREPMGDLADDVAARLAKAKIPITGDRKASLFRVHRDIRFTSNKDPYKTNSGLAMSRSGEKSDPGTLYFHLAPEGSFFAAGFYMPDPHELARLRAAAVRDAEGFRRLVAKLRRAGLALDEQDSLKRQPRGLEDLNDPQIAAAVRLRSFICIRPVDEALIAKPELAQALTAFTKDALPLFRWGWDALAELRALRQGRTHMKT
jgi:uncharacterized protein (TIGR02453 family)